MHLVQPQDDPDNWLMLEMFRSRAAWDEHMQQPYNTEGNRILEDPLLAPRWPARGRGNCALTGWLPSPVGPGYR